MHWVSMAITKTTKVLNPSFTFFRGLYALKPQNDGIFWWYSKCSHANCFKTNTTDFLRMSHSQRSGLRGPCKHLGWQLLKQTVSFSFWVFFCFLFFWDLKNEKNVCNFFTGETRNKNCFIVAEQILFEQLVSLMSENNCRALSLSQLWPDGNPASINKVHPKGLKGKVKLNSFLQIKMDQSYHSITVTDNIHS